ncbi:MAG: hypothetical protein V4473_01060 [Patescibacteria group bacterium]
MSTQATVQIEALRVWQIILAILLHGQDVGPSAVDTHLKGAPKPHIEGIQRIIRDSKCHTSEFVPDGVWGDQSTLSLRQLYFTAHPSN